MPSTHGNVNFAEITKQLEWDYTVPSYYMGRPTNKTPPTNSLLVKFLRNRYTKDLDHIIPQLREEAIYAIDNAISGDGTTNVELQKTITEIVTSTVSGQLLGRPMSRDRRYIDASTQHLIALGSSVPIVSPWPNFMKR